MTVPVQIYDSISGAVEGAPAFGSAAELRLTRFNAAALTPGRFVCRDGNDRKVKVPTTIAEVRGCLGIAELSETQILSSNTTGDYPINTRLSVVRKGVIWMIAVDACTQGEDVYVYYAGAVAKGKCGGAYVAGENTKLPGCKFFTTQATPGSLVAVEVDLPAGAASFVGEFGSGNGYVDVVVDLPNILAATAPDVSTLVTGSIAGDSYVVTALTALTTGLVICDARCRVSGTVVWRVANVTVGAVDPASNTFRFSLVSRG
jgi:hypothetical protein